MIESLNRNWWIQLIRGGLAFALGATALVAPASSLTLAVFLVAAFAIGDGAMTLTAGLGIRDRAEVRGVLTATGAAFIALGVAVLFWPGLGATALILLFAAWLVASGALVVYGARVLGDVVSNSWIMTTVGAVVAVAGLALALVGPSTIESFLLFAGWFGVIVGVIMAAVAFRLRSNVTQLPAPRPLVAA